MRDGISEGDFARFQIQFSFGRRAKHARTPVIEFAFPSRDDDRRQTIADHVYARAAHVHQFIHAEDDRHADRPEASGQKAI